MTIRLCPAYRDSLEVVRVKADLDFDQRSTTTESFAQPAAGQTNPVVNESTSKETFAGPGASSAAGGVLGTAGQTNPAGGAAGAGRRSSRDNFHLCTHRI